MASKDVSIFRFVLPLLLVFFIAAGSAIGCPEHRTTTAYRTKAINSRSVSYMAPVVITYGGPASYQRCTDSRYGTKRVNVPVRRDDYYEGGARYVAVRNYVPRARVIVRDLDYDDASSRYVTVRRQPAYVDSSSRYVAVRNYAPRTRYVVRDVDYDDAAPSYVAVRRQPVYEEPAPRYVAVRNYAPRTRYVAVNNVVDDDDDYMPSPVENVVVGNHHDEYIAPPRANNVIDDDDDYIAPPVDNVVVNDDDAYIAPPVENFVGKRYVVDYSDPYFDRAGDSPTESETVTTPAAAGTMTVRYGPADLNNDADNLALLDNEGVTYVATDDVEDAYLSPASVPESSAVVDTNAVSYLPTDDIDHDIMGTDVTYVHDDDGFSVRYRPLFDDEDVVDTQTAYVAAVDDEVETEPVGYVQLDDADAMNVRVIPVERLSYVSNDETDFRTVAYVPEDSIDFDTTDLDADCPMTVSTLDGEAVQFEDSSAVLVDDDDDFVPDDQLMANEGYEDTFGE